MLKAIVLQNFKGIRDKIRIELKPITLFFGANSSGKSTVLQALHYAREILERHNLDSDRTLFGGEVIDLGGFRNLVHNRDLNLPIVLQFELDFSNVDIPVYEEIPLHERHTDLSNSIKTVAIELVTRWSPYKQHPVVSAYRVWVNDVILVKIELEGEVRIEIHYNHTHPLFGGPDFLGSDFNQPGEDGNDGAETSDKSVWITLDDEQLTSCLPKWDKPFKITFSDSEFEDFTGFNAKFFNRILSQAVIGPGKILRDILRRFRYVGPLRTIPTRTHRPSLSPDESRWSDGTAAWEALYRNGPSFWEQVSSWMSDPDKLNSGYRLLMKYYKELDLNHPLALALSQGRAFDDVEAQKQFEKIPSQKRLVLVESTKGLEVLPQDIGVGISQVLPVVTVALDQGSDIVAIEQPELHVHPAIQVSLGDLFISQIGNGKLFLIETHSEHLILRLLRRIREVFEGKIKEDDPKALSPSQINVFYIEQETNGVKLTNLNIDETGEFIDRWPKGFFEERAEELF